MSHASFGLCCVDLTHISSCIRPLYISDMQVPGSMPLVRNSDSRIASDNSLVNSQNGRSVIMNPGHFVTIQIFDGTRKKHISAFGNCDVL